MTAIVFAADVQYLPYLPCNLAQVARFGRRAERVALVVPSTLDSAGRTHVEAIEEVASALGISLQVVPMPELAQLHAQGAAGSARRVSGFSNSKLLLADTVTDLDQVLYLDVDTMIRAPLDDLLDWELRNPLGAVPELTASAGPLFGSVRVPYFNAGVLRMSLSRLRGERLWDRSVETMAARPGLSHPDVLNLLFRGRFDSLPLSFNVQHALTARHRMLPIFRNAAIVHFTGPAKPWQPGTVSPYAAEWRMLYGSLALEGSTDDGGHAALPSPGHHAQWNVMSSVMRIGKRVLPNRVKRKLKPLGLRALNGALVRLHLAQLWLDPDSAPLSRSALPRGTSAARRPIARPAASGVSDSGLDLVISVARSGTSAFGAVIRRDRPQVHWMGELYQGLSTPLERDEVAQFPWFVWNRREIRLELPRQRRERDQIEFSRMMSVHAVDFTRRIMERRPGRTLIKVFPDHLSAEALDAVVREFRPRLIFLRRHLLFSFLSHLRANESQSWARTDSTDVPITVREQDISPYVDMCDSFMDHAGRLALELDLPHASLTYDGLYASGTDVPLLEAFYPGAPLPGHADTGRLKSPMLVQDRRTDASLLRMIASFDALSEESKRMLLRLPGKELDRYLSQQSRQPTA